MHKYAFIVNPASADGTTGTEWPLHKLEIEKYFKSGLLENESSVMEVFLTEAPFHAVELTKKALESGFDTIVAVGGDGTMNEVANGFFNDDLTLINPDARLAVLSMGTGCDFIKTLGLKKGIESFIEALKRNEEKIIDVGWLTASHSKICGRKKRVFLNIADSGMGAETTDRVNKKSKHLKGFLSFLIGALGTMLVYRDRLAEVQIDGVVVANEKINSVIVANGKYFGGGMKVSPNSILDDGLLDIVIIKRMIKPILFKSFFAIYSGKHINNPKCSFYKGKNVKVVVGYELFFKKVQFKNDMYTELDGEQVGYSDAEFGIIPNCLKIIY